MPRICIEGNIGTGKSTLLARLEKDGHVVIPEAVDEWRGWLELFYKEPKRWAFSFQMKVLACFARIDQEDAIVERSPLSNRHVFAQMLYNQGCMSEKEWNVFRQYHSLVSWKPHAIIYIKTSPETCYRRIQERRRPGEDGIDIEYVKKVDFHYTNLVRYLDCQVFTVDGERTQDEVYRDVCNILRRMQ